MLKEKIKNTEAIGKAIELLVKVTDKETDPEQIERLLNVIHELSGIHQESVGNLRNTTQKQHIQIANP